MILEKLKKLLSSILFIVVFLAFGALCGCVSGDMKSPKDDVNYQIWLNSGSCFVYSFEDDETGVWYIATGKGVTPRLNADGSLYVED